MKPTVPSIADRIRRRASIFVQYIWLLLTHLFNWLAGSFGLILLLVEVFPELGPFFPSNRTDRIVLGVRFGLLVSGYRVYEETRAAEFTQNAKIAACGQEVRNLKEAAVSKTTPKPQLTVELANSSDGNKTTMPVVTDRILAPDLDAIERDARAEAEKKYVQTGEEINQLISQHGLPEIFLFSSVKDKTRYKEDVDKYVKHMRESSTNKYHYTMAKEYVKEVALVVINVGDVLARDLYLQVDIPPTWRMASELDIDWAKSRIEPTFPELPEPAVNRLEAYGPLKFNFSDTPDFDVRSDARRPTASTNAGRWIVTYVLGDIPAYHTVSDLKPFYTKFRKPESAHRRRRTSPSSYAGD